MNKKIFASAIALLLVFSAVIIIVNVKKEAEDHHSDTVVDPKEDIPFTNRNVVVFSDDDFLLQAEKDLSIVTSKVSKKSSLGDAMMGDVIVIQESWVRDNDREKINEEIKTAMSNNMLLIFVGNDLYELTYSVLDIGMDQHLEKQNLYAIYTYDGIDYSLTLDVENEAKSIQLAYVWGNAALSGEPYETLRNFNKINKETLVIPQESVISKKEAKNGDSPSWELIGMKDTVVHCKEYGYLSLTLWVSKLMNFDNGYNYYAYHFAQYAEPDSSNGDYRMADMSLRDLNGTPYLIGHGPNTAYDTNSVIVSDSLMSWIYNMTDVVLINTSQIGTQTVNFYHDVVESSEVGRTGYVAEPGLFFRVPSGEDCQVELYHEVQFCKKIGGHWIVIGNIPMYQPDTYRNYEKFGCNWSC